MKVFLGGTCNGSTWRDELIESLSPQVEYFNPVVPNWTPECQEEELKQRELCDYVLYTITPKMSGVYSIAEVVDDSHKKKNKTLFCLLYEDDATTYTEASEKSLEAVMKLLQRNDVRCFKSLSDVSIFLNAQSFTVFNTEK